MTDSGYKVSRKGRTAASCDRCKARKTKCSNPVPGPCDQCRRADADCQIDLGKRRQRPFYFVSEEEYQHMQKILKHYLPNTDLTPATLRSIASQCGEPQRDSSQSSSNLDAPVPLSASSAPGGKSERPEVTRHQRGDDLALQEIVNLHEDLGCMLADARGQYRYMGADSGVAFNTAVRAFKTTSPQVPKDRNVIPGLETVTLPIPGSKDTPLAQVLSNLRLPPRDQFSKCASQYFAQVHCLHWLYSSEEFHTRLQESYADQGKIPSASWMCSLYCIFILGALGSSLLDTEPEPLIVEGYLEKAKSLSPQVCDEADLDSIRALLLLALALHSSAFSNSAYLYTGVAVRIAFSLGLHLDKYSSPDDPVRKEHARRIWWSLYMYDQELALRLGKPCMTGTPAGVSWQPAVPPEEILNPGPHTPPGYLQLSITLTEITKSARNVLFVEPMSGGRKLSLSDFDVALSSLREWLASVPPYLSPSAPSAPLYKRSIAVLRVRYWNAVMLVSRPFLFCIFLRRTQLQQTSRLKHFEEISGLCIDAAEKSLEIQQKMMEERLLSSALVADFYYSLDVLQVLLVAYSLYRSEKHLNNTRRCLEVLKTMGSSGYCQKMLPEVLNQLRDWGVFSSSSENLGNFQELDTFFADMEPGNELYEMLFNPDEPFNNGDSDMDFFDVAASGQLINQIMDL